MKLYLRERPRTFIVVLGPLALVLRHPFPIYKDSGRGGASAASQAADPSMANKVVAESVRADAIDFSRFRDITPLRPNCQLLAFLGLLPLKQKIVLAFITGQDLVGSPTIQETIYRISSVEFCCLNSDEDDDALFSQFAGTDSMMRSINESELSLSHSTDRERERERLTQTHGTSVKKLLSSGSFYYSRDFDITSSLQERGFNIDGKPRDSLFADSNWGEQFAWNYFMNQDLIEFRNRLQRAEQVQFDKLGFLVSIMRGFVKTVYTKVDDDPSAHLTLISKQACSKNGPLFGHWGCDDNGAVLNFCESEVIISTPKVSFSYVILRGNVPIHWQIQSKFKKNLLSTKSSKSVQFDRSFEASQHAFQRHFDAIASQFGEVHIIDALSQNEKDYKGQLNQEFRKHVEYFNLHRISDEATYKLASTDIPLPSSLIRRVGYTTQDASEVVVPLVNALTDFGALLYDTQKRSYTGKQLGVFRVISFDSLSKANFISKVIAQEVIEHAFNDVNIPVSTALLHEHANLWKENGEQLKFLTENYASHSAKLQSSSSLMKRQVQKKLGVVSDSTPKESAILKLLGGLQDQVGVTLHNPIHDYVEYELKERKNEFSFYEDICLYASTFNVNGCKYPGDIRHWLFPVSSPPKSYDLVFIGFQETVELTAGKMVNTHMGNRIFWEKKIQDCLDEHNPDGARYVRLWSGQIGGMSLLLYVKESEIKNIGNVQGAFKKTGLGGMSANKGGVAVSFDYANTEICLVLSHLAAGLSNLDERHQNYKTIAKGIKFSKNRRIKDHDAVIWLGDFNYRINLSNEQARYLIDQKDYAKLFEFDQLNQQMSKGESFPFYDEMEITFPPTYKFDNGTSTYDTSEKQRVPAWTDRVLSLSRDKVVNPLAYDSVPDLMFSDHRPVYAMFNLHVLFTNDQKKQALSNEIREAYRSNYGDINDLLNNNNVAHLLHGLNQALPPPSSDAKKWWLEGGKPAKIVIPQLTTKELDMLYVNPLLPVNPFAETTEPEFVNADRLREIMTPL